MKHKYFAKYGNILLRPLEKADIEKLRVWRNDTEMTRFLRPIGYISPEMQEQWYDSYLANLNEITFAIVETEKLNRIIGSLSLYNFSESCAEIGKIQIGDKEARGNGYSGIAFVMAMKIGFNLLKVKKIHASVHQENYAAYKNYSKIGMYLTGSHPSVVGGTEDEIEITEEILYSANAFAETVEIGMLHTEL